MSPIEGFLIKGAEVSDTRDNSRRDAEAVNADLLAAYEKIRSRGGDIIARDAMLTPLTGHNDHEGYRHDLHLVVDFPE